MSALDAAAAGALPLRSPAVAAGKSVGVVGVHAAGTQAATEPGRGGREEQEPWAYRTLAQV